MLTFFEEFSRRPLKRKFLYLIWCVLHIIFHFLRNCLETIQTIGKRVTKQVSSLFVCAACGQGSSKDHHDHKGGHVNYLDEVTKLAQNAAVLKKLPKYLAFSIVPENASFSSSSSKSVSEDDVDISVEKNCHQRSQNSGLKREEQKIQMQILARVISWAWAAKIQMISLYDYDGEIKSSHHELGYLLQEELVLNYMGLKSQNGVNTKIFPSPPTIKFHNVPNINGYSKGVNGVKNANTLHIAVFSHEDGKRSIAQIARDTCKPDDSLVVNESFIDSKLNSAHELSSLPPGISPEPEVLVVLGKVRSTLGFLPWNIRLSEIFWVPRLPMVESEDFLDVLRKYSRCQQRFGT